MNATWLLWGILIGCGIGMSWGFLRLAVWYCSQGEESDEKQKGKWDERKK
jgi:hypothetical protein